MKKLVTVLIAFTSITVLAANIKWWTKTAEENLADLGPATTSPFAVDIGSSKKSISGVNDAVRGVDWPDNYILQICILGTDLLKDRSGNTISTISDWSSDKYAIGVQVGVNENGSIRWCDPTFDNEGYTDVIIDSDGIQALQFQLGNPNSSQSIILELGYYDDDYNFFGIASATDLYGNLSGHIYKQGSILPPVTDWHPAEFVVYAVPEPSTFVLALVGMALLIKRRK